ncbi:hypothetical protein G4B88_005040 [Cannabis sativa]|uniref:Uncharacterized protein n=1 Tax=Cannabis sativa TaxID=3483 RepID=A0A7J6H4D2_CANSA|nr:hypothetical protein G4B88_005040 [Cannabis sativa]
MAKYAGPGCSSIGYGASEEIGPFRINKTTSSLYLNKYSWNREANLLFLESPAGVGFSYTNTSSDLENSGDKRTAQDALVFLLRWMSRFPEYKYREFYIAGESYAVTDNYYDSIGTVTYWWSHAMISDKTYNSILHHCNFSSDTASNACDDVVYYAMNHEFGDIDQYNIYTPTCANSSSSNNKHYLRLKNSLLRRRFSGYDPCTEGYAEKYYNRKDVQRAMHANTTRIPYKWTACSDVLIKNWKDSENSVLPTYKYLIAAGLRIWVFSGDTDSVVPVTATRFSLSHLNLTTKTRWYPWYTGGQVGGWTESEELAMRFHSFNRNELSFSSNRFWLGKNCLNLDSGRVSTRRVHRFERDDHKDEATYRYRDHSFKFSNDILIKTTRSSILRTLTSGPNSIAASVISVRTGCWFPDSVT